jgi:hypothetical protein
MLVPRLAQQPSTHSKASGNSGAAECDRRRKQALECKNPAIQHGIAEPARKISIIFANSPKVPASPAVKGGQPVIRPKKIVAVFT